MAARSPLAWWGPPGGALLLLVALVACRGTTVSSGTGTPARTPSPDVVGHASEASETVGRTRAEVELGIYARDARVHDLAAGWAERVSQAQERLALVTGLAFPPDIAPRVILMPLGNEHEDQTLSTEVFEGRRLPVVRVNVEPIAAGRRDADRVLLQALAAAMFEGTGSRNESSPAWVVRAATIVAGGDLDERLVRLGRREETEGPIAVRIDPQDPTAAESTGVAAVLVLLEDGEPDVLRRFFAFAAEGDDANALLARRLRDPLGQWAGAGRALLRDRLDRLDMGPWRLLATARTALEETGRGGMESILPETLPAEIEAEVTVLRARAFADEGDYEHVRYLLGSLDAPAWARLDDPAAAAWLRVLAERASGGDLAVAERLEARWRRDYPRCVLRAALDPEVEVGPTESIWDVEEVRRRVEDLLAGHRAGAARRLLEGLGDRALAVELAGVHRAVAEAETSPSPTSIEVNRRRVAAWVVEPSTRTAAAVLDGGGAAALPLAEAVPERAGDARRETVRLLARAGGAGRAVELLAASWRAGKEFAIGDLDALLGVAAYAELRVWAEGLASDILAPQAWDAMWERLRFGLDENWVRANGRILRNLRSSSYAVRRGAFDEVVVAGQATPDLVAKALADPAALLRREAVEVAGRHGFRALVRLALEDEAWMVRQAACGAAVRALGDDAATPLLHVYAADPAPQVRLAAATALFPLAERNERVLQALLSGLASGDPGMRNEVTARLRGLPSSRVAHALLGALAMEVRRPAPRASYVAHLFLVLRRVIGRDPGYTPDMTREQLASLVDRLRAWMAREEARRGR